MDSNKRLLWLDALKGLGILSVMRVHMLPPMEKLQSIVYVGAVAMFFVVAGFNLKCPESIGASLSSKAKRLLVPYFFYSVLLLLLEHRIDGNTLVHIVGVFYARMHFFSIADNDSMALLVLGNAPMWFLPCMFLAYVWVYVCYFRRSSVGWRVMSVAAFLFFSVMLSFSPILLPWSIDTSFFCAVLMVIGLEWRAFFLSTRVICAGVAFAVWGMFFYFFSGSNLSVGKYGAYGVWSMIPFVIIALSETYALSALLQWLDGSYVVKVLAYVGRHSLRLMCIHLVIYNRMLGVLSCVCPEFACQKWLVLPVAFAAIFLVDALIEEFRKRMQMKWKIVRYL